MKHISFFLTTLIFILSLAACGGGQSPTAATLTFNSQLDNAVQTATWYPAETESAPPVLLLHMLGSNRAVWQEFAGQLNTAGYAVLALDLRGHGDSAGERDWSAVAADVSQAFDLMLTQPGVNADKAAIIGGSIGANLAIVEAAANPAVQTIALLSPGLDYEGVMTAEAMAQIGDRPVLIVNSNDDTQAVFDGFTLGDLAIHENSRVSQMIDSGHGTNMLTANPDTANLLVEWLDIQLR